MEPQDGFALPEYHSSLPLLNGLVHDRLQPDSQQQHSTDALMSGSHSTADEEAIDADAL